MSTVINDRDVLIESLPRNIAPSQGRAFVLGADTPVFTVDAGGLGTPSVINLKAQLINIVGTVSWSVTGATGLTVAGDSLSATLAFSAVTASTITVTAQIPYLGVTYIASQILQKVTAGIQGSSTAQVYAYKRSATAPIDNPGAVTWTFSAGAITTPATDALANGWTKTIPAGPDPLYVTLSSALGTGTTDTIAAGEWATPVKLVQDGLAGLNSATVFIYQRSASATPPTLPSATTTYTFNTGTLTGLNNGWSYQVPAGTSTYLYVSQATAVSNTTTDNILASEWATVQLLAQNGTNGSNGSPGSPGTRGTVNLAGSGFASWSDSAANSLIASNGYGSPINSDIVTLYNASFSQTRFYSSGSWLVLSAYINGNLLVSGTLQADKIVAGSTLSGVNISGGTLNIANQLVVTSGGIVDAYSFFGHTSQFSNLNNPSLASIRATCTSSTTAISSIGTTALFADGLITMPSRSPGVNNTKLNSIIASTDNTYQCGYTSNAWQGVYTYSVVNPSDRRLKENIQDLSYGLAFVRNLRPVSYTMIVGQNDIEVGPEQAGPWADGIAPEREVVVIPRKGTRTHLGFIAQEVRESLGRGDVAVWSLGDKDDLESSQGLSYIEMIAPLTKALQQLDEIVQQQAAIIAQLQADVAALKGT